MKSKKGGNKKGKKGGKEKGGGKKPPQQAPRGDVKPEFALPESERGFVPGFGCMVTKSWAAAKEKKHAPLMVEIARTNMQRYCDKVTDVQSKASLLHILGYSLTQTGEVKARKEGRTYNMEALELIRSMGERSTEDIVFGVWPETCLNFWGTFLKQLDVSERNKEMEWMLEMINLTRRTINSKLEIVADEARDVERLQPFSQMHYETELRAISGFSLDYISLLNLEDAERWLAIFGKRTDEIGVTYKRESWDLDFVTETKSNLLKFKCDLYERQGKLELAFDTVREALEEERHALILDNLHAELSLKTGRIEEAFKSMEKDFSYLRSIGEKIIAAPHFRYYLRMVPKDSRSLSVFMELIPKYPHVLWAANAAGFATLSEEQKKALRSQLEAKKTLRCVNCSKELTKVYRCSRCNVATYCGSACQKEAWKEHKKICKKRE
jgi:tetratricopeptide (TPR) repeat protein